MARLTLWMVGLLLLITASVFAQPDIKIANARFEMGTIPQNSTVTHFFWFKSVGTDTLVIDEIKTGCGCTLMPLEKHRLAPGDSMKVTICWNVRRKIGATGSYPYIYTNVEGRPERVYLTGTITKFADSTRPVTIKPYILDVSRVGDNSVDSLEFSIRNYSDKDIAVSRLSFDVPECDVVFPDTIPANSTVRGSVKVKSEFLDKDFRRSFTLLLAGEREFRVTVPIRRKIY